MALLLSLRRQWRGRGCPADSRMNYDAEVAKGAYRISRIVVFCSGKQRVIIRDFFAMLSEARAKVDWRS